MRKKKKKKKKTPLIFDWAMSSIINSKPVLVLLSRSIRLVSMLQAAAGSQAPLARTVRDRKGYKEARMASIQMADGGGDDDIFLTA